MVITGLTRNQLGSNPPRVRISPSPPKKKDGLMPSFYFVRRDSKPRVKKMSLRDIFTEVTPPLEEMSRMRQRRCRLRLSNDDETHPPYVNPTNEMKHLYT